MNNDYLVSMANDIAAFFASESGEAEAPKSIAGHIARYWDPRMRREIIDYYQSKGGAGLTDLSLKAIAILAEQAAKAPSASH